jgi:hypothetical protein
MTMFADSDPFYVRRDPRSLESIDRMRILGGWVAMKSGKFSWSTPELAFESGCLARMIT